MSGVRKEKLDKIRHEITPILHEWGVIRAGIFGSFARGEEKKKSDVDILIEVKKSKKFSLLDLVHMEYEMEDRLGRKVDLLTYDSIHPLLKKSILAEEVRLYGKG